VPVEMVDLILEEELAEARGQVLRTFLIEYNTREQTELSEGKGRN